MPPLPNWGNMIGDGRTTIFIGRVETVLEQPQSDRQGSTEIFYATASVKSLEVIQGATSDHVDTTGVVRVVQHAEPGESLCLKFLELEPEEVVVVADWGGGPIVYPASLVRGSSIESLVRKYQ